MNITNLNIRFLISLIKNMVIISKFKKIHLSMQYFIIKFYEQIISNDQIHRNPKFINNFTIKLTEKL